MSTEPHDLNQVIIGGRLSRDAELRELPSGDRLVLLRVVAKRPGATRVDSLPVAVGPPPGRGERRRPGQALSRDVRLAGTLVRDDRVHIEGRLERRFWRADGVPRSRLQILAEAVRRG